MEQILAFLSDLPPLLLYVVLGLGAAIENVLPIVPADTVIVTGGFIAGLGVAGVIPVFLAVWGFNVAGALAVYAVGRRYGPEFFATGRGRHLLAERQMRRLEAFYARWGVAAIFAGRFLPGFRALVPVFAGVAGLGWSRVVPPLVVASAIWYGALVSVGHVAGENAEVVVEKASRGLLAVSAALAIVLLAVWWRARRRAVGGDGTGAA